MKKLFTLLFLLFLAQLNRAQISSLQLDSTELEVSILLDNLVIPWDMHWDPGGWVWFSEREGKISRFQIETGTLQFIHFIEDTYQSSDNSGLHALALHPDFPAVPYVYAHYTYTRWRSRFVRYTFDEDNLLLKDPYIILDELEGNTSHNGSRIVFTPDKNKLFLCLGDAFMSGRALELEEYAGKILRMNLDGSVPDGNPFPNSLVWSYGHRNPQGLVLAPNGILYSSEHGGGEDDELNIIEKGKNYGWPEVAGFCQWREEAEYCAANEVILPLKTWSPTYAVSGMDYYDHEAIPEWRNSLLQTSLKASDGSRLGQRLQLLKLSSDGREVESVTDYFKQTFGRLRDVLVLPDGRILITTSNKELNGNGDAVVKPDDDKMIMLRNPDYHGPSVPQADVEDVLLYPNPAGRSFSLKFKESFTEIKLSLRDLQGKLIWEKELFLNGSPLAFINEDFGGGLYLLEVEFGDGKRVSKKLVIK
ncbi:MAG: PQQ-dependent sugar dehydrogenase [Bacteroidota bacterium]